MEYTQHGFRAYLTSLKIIEPMKLAVRKHCVQIGFVYGQTVAGISYLGQQEIHIQLIKRLLFFSELIPFTIEESNPAAKGIKEKILEAVGSTTYQSWFMSTIISQEKNKVVIDTPGALFRDTIENHHKSKIEEILGVPVYVCFTDRVER